MRVRIKVCCISSAHEARMAIEAGADALGLVGEMPSGPGVISDADIAEIATHIPPPAASVLLTSRSRADAIADYANAAGVTTVQIVSHIEPDEYRRLRQRLPGRRFFQVVHVEDETAIELAKTYARHADGLLLDSGRPGAAELGGTGRTHDWNVSARLVETVSIPVFLAGGLNPENVGEAIRAVRPFGVDVCSAACERTVRSIRSSWRPLPAQSNRFETPAIDTVRKNAFVSLESNTKYSADGSPHETVGNVVSLTIAIGLRYSPRKVNTGKF